MKEESEKAGLKLNIEKTNIMPSGPITSWQIDGETVTDYFLGLHNHCRWWLQPWNLRCLLPERKAMINLDSVLKSRDIALLTKVHIVKAMVFSVEGLILKLKFQYFGHLMQRVNSRERPWCREWLKAGGEGMTEDEMLGWHHWLNGHEFEQSLGDSEGQGSLARCSSWGLRESGMN